MVDLRIATWNVERPAPRGWKIPPAQRKRMAEVDADVWVLTETNTTHAPGAEFTGVFSPSHPTRRPEHERWAAIWSKHPMVELTEPAGHRRGTVAARIEGPLGPLVVYGTVIPWANERSHDDGTPARMWEVHLAEIDRQGAEWLELVERNPTVPLVVAGDFNQDRDGSAWYGTHEARERLTHQLEVAGLTCATEFDAAERDGLDSHLVDHLCHTAHLGDPTISCLPRADEAGVRLSDHPTVVASW